MSNYDEGTQDFDIFDDTPANEYVDPQRSKFTFTPCTRFANLMINSQSNGNGRVRSFTGEGTVSDFNEKLMRGLYGDKGIVEESRPKNLDMVVGGDRISFLDKRKAEFFEEDDESDEGDMSSGLFSMISAENEPSYFHGRNIFEDEDDDFQMMETNVFDHTSSWLAHIYQNTSEDDFETMTNNNNEEDEEEYQENRPPRNWTPRLDKEKQQQQSYERIPLKEIHTEADDFDVPTAKKKFIISNGKTQQKRIMRTLSPPRNFTKRKTPLSNSNSHSLTTL